MRFAAIAEVRAYWEALREAGALPRRDRIDPRGLAGALDQVFIAERVAPGLARFRLAGMQINDLMGMEVRGMPLSALMDPAGRPRLAEAIEGVFAGPACGDLMLEAERGIGKPALEARLLLLPLQGTRGEASLLLGCLALEGTTGRAPRRFAVARALLEPIADGQAARTLVAPAFAEDPVPFRPAPAVINPAATHSATPPRPAGKPHLRLVKSDD